MFEKFFSKCFRYVVRKGHLFGPVACLTIAFAISACQSSTAVKGVPVNEIPITKAPRAKRAQTQQMRKELALMSKVKENKCFHEISGIPEYRIGPLDVLEIKAHSGEKVNTTTVTVDSRGRISYSFLDDLHSPEFIATMDYINLFHKTGEKHCFFHSRISATYNYYNLVLIEVTITCGAI